MPGGDDKPMLAELRDERGAQDSLEQTPLPADHGQHVLLEKHPITNLANVQCFSRERAAPCQPSAYVSRLEALVRQAPATSEQSDYLDDECSHSGSGQHNDRPEHVLRVPLGGVSGLLRS